MARYVVGDLDGRSHAYFGTRDEARAGLREIVAGDPQLLDQLYVVGYDSAGRRFYGPVTAADFLRAKKTVAMAGYAWPGSTFEAVAVATTNKQAADAPLVADERHLVLA